MKPAKSLSPIQAQILSSIHTPELRRDLVAYAMTLLDSDLHLANEAVNRAFMSLGPKLPLDPKLGEAKPNYRAWLFHALDWRIEDVRRPETRARRLISDSIDDPDFKEPTPDTGQESPILNELASRPELESILTNPTKLRAFRLRIAGLSHEHIAKELGCALQHVHNIIKEASLTLRILAIQRLRSAGLTEEAIQERLDLTDDRFAKAAKKAV